MYQYVGNNPANGVDIWGLECNEPNIIERKLPLSISVSGAITAQIDDKYFSGKRKCIPA